MFVQQTAPSVAVGQGIFSWSPGFLITGVKLDNPSGLWISVDSGKFLIAPWTIGFAANLDGTSSLTIEYVNIPGPITTTATGDPFTATIYNATIQEAPGVAVATQISGGSITATIGGTVNTSIVGGTVDATILAGTVDVQNVVNGVLSSAGTLRYVGSQAGSGTLAVALSAVERSIIVVVPSNALATTTVTVQTVSGIQTKISTFPVTAIATPGLTIAYANPNITANWEVVIAADPTQTCYIFADSDLATVAIASDETAPVFTQIVNNGPLSGGGAVVPLYVQSVHGNTDLIGQQTMAGSLPVVPASDYNIPNTLAVQNPAVGVRALVSIPAVAGKKCTCTWIAVSLTQTAAAAGNVDMFVTDAAGGGGNVWLEVNLAVDGVAGHCTTFAMQDLNIQSAVGAGMTVGFLAALPGVIQRVSAGIIQA